MCFSRLLLSSKDIGIYGKRAGTKLTHKGGRGAFCVRKGHTPCHSCVLCQGAVMKARLHRRLLYSLDCWLVQIGEGINSHERRRMVRCTVTGSTAQSTEGHRNITSLLTFSPPRSNLAHTPGFSEVEEGITGNWVSFTCLYRNDSTHQLPKAGVTPSTLDPRTCILPLTSKVSQKAALFWSSPPFYQDPLKNPSNPCNFRCNVYLAGREGLWGGLGG